MCDQRPAVQRCDFIKIWAQGNLEGQVFLPEWTSVACSCRDVKPKAKSQRSLFGLMKKPWTSPKSATKDVRRK